MKVELVTHTGWDLRDDLNLFEYNGLTGLFWTEYNGLTGLFWTEYIGLTGLFWTEYNGLTGLFWTEWADRLILNRMGWQAHFKPNGLTGLF